MAWLGPESRSGKLHWRLVAAPTSAEAKFAAASATVQEVIYTCRYLENLRFSQKPPTTVYEDNRTCVAWSEGSKAPG